MDRDDDERFQRPDDDDSFDDEARFTHEDDTEVAPPRDPRTARPAHHPRFAASSWAASCAAFASSSPAFAAGRRPCPTL